MHLRLYAFPVAAGAIALGLAGLFFADFPLQPQRFAGAPAHAALAALSNIALIGAALLMLVPRTARIGALALAAIYLLFAALLLVMVVLPAPLSVGAWLAPAEVEAMAAGGAILFAIGLRRPAPWITVIRILFGINAIIFGASHFAYPEITASLVPFPPATFWAYLTGTAHTLAGIALLVGVQVRLAASLEALMCACFVLLVHVPRVLAAPGTGAEWTMLASAMAIAAGAWSMRLASRSEPPAEPV